MNIQVICGLGKIVILVVLYKLSVSKKVLLNLKLAHVDVGHIFIVILMYLLTVRRAVLVVLAKYLVNNVLIHTQKTVDLISV